MKKEDFNITEFLSSIPQSIASPILDYVKTKEESKLLELTIELNYAQNNEILRTIQVLAQNGQAPPEVVQLLMSHYNTPALIS